MIISLEQSFIFTELGQQVTEMISLDDLELPVDGHDIRLMQLLNKVGVIFQKEAHGLHHLGLGKGGDGCPRWGTSNTILPIDPGM